MSTKSKLLLALLATSSAAFAQTAPAAAESAIAYNVGVVSEYRYRGLAQTKGDPAFKAVWITPTPTVFMLVLGLQRSSGSKTCQWLVGQPKVPLS